MRSSAASRSARRPAGDPDPAAARWPHRAASRSPGTPGADPRDRSGAPAGVPGRARAAAIRARGHRGARRAGRQRLRAAARRPGPGAARRAGRPAGHRQRCASSRSSPASARSATPARSTSIAPRCSPSPPPCTPATPCWRGWASAPRLTSPARSAPTARSRAAPAGPCSACWSPPPTPTRADHSRPGRARGPDRGRRPASARSRSRPRAAGAFARTADKVSELATPRRRSSPAARSRAELAAALRKRVQGAIPDRRRRREVPRRRDGVVRADGAVPSRVEATALAVLALETDPRASLADLGTTHARQLLGRARLGRRPRPTWSRCAPCSRCSAIRCPRRSP